MRPLALLLLLSCASPASAGYISSTYGTSDPNGAWAYFEAVGVGHGNSTTYVPLRADYLGLAVAEGYVFYPGGGPANPAAGWIHQQPSLYDEDTIRVFRTYFLSPTDMNISVTLGGDDGHSLYVDGLFVGGGGFGVPVNSTIHLEAGAATEVELLGYNGPGPWQLVFRRQDGGEVADTPGLSIRADDQFVATPEPSSLTLLGIGLTALFVGPLRRALTRTSSADLSRQRGASPPRDPGTATSWPSWARGTQPFDKVRCPSKPHRQGCNIWSRSSPRPVTIRRTR